MAREVVIATTVVAVDVAEGGVATMDATADASQPTDPTSSTVPTSPVARMRSMARVYERMTDDMDVNAGAMLSHGVSLEDKGREIYDMFLRVASGEQTKSEAQGLGDYEFVPWQIGAVM